MLTPLLQQYEAQDANIIVIDSSLPEYASTQSDVADSQSTCLEITPPGFNEEDFLVDGEEPSNNIPAVCVAECNVVRPAWCKGACRTRANKAIDTGNT